jgi:Spy/CpxP family protein refolding chaperone
MLIRKARTLPMFVIGVLLLGFPGFVHANSDHMRHRGYDAQHQRGMHDSQHFVGQTFRSLLRHSTELGLSGEQVTKLKSLMTDYYRTRIRDKADVKLAEVDVRTLVHDQKAEMSAIENAVHKSEAAQAKLRLDGIRAVREASATLTPEQREKWRSSRAVMHADAQGKGRTRS